MKESSFAFYSPLMPALSQWLPRLPAIIGELKVLAAPVIDRALVERLFFLKRRQAIDLCHRFGGFQADSFSVFNTRKGQRVMERRLFSSRAGCDAP